MSRLDKIHTSITRGKQIVKDLQIRIAVEMFNKRGAEGEIAHSENGVSRSYASANVSEDLLKEITPKVGVV